MSAPGRPGQPLLPRRQPIQASAPPEPTAVGLPPFPASPSVRRELADLRQRVPGVQGCLVAGVDGLLITYEPHTGAEPEDLAALAATTLGLSRQCSQALRHGPLREATVHSHRGYFAVYAIRDLVLLGVIGDETLNVARLHLEARPATDRLATLLYAAGPVGPA